MNIVINRTDAIGDFLLTLPMVEFIKDRYPKAKISFLLSPRNAELVLCCPSVDDYFIWNPKESLFKRIFKLHKYFYKKKFDYYFFVGGSQFISLISLLSGISFRGGLKSKWLSFLFLNKGVRQSRSLVEMHEREYNLNLLKVFDKKLNFQDYKKFVPKVMLKDSQVRADLGSFKQNLDIEGFKVHLPWAFIHPGMSGHTLNWPIKNYARLILELANKTQDKIFFLISYTESDMKFINLLKKELSGPEYETIKSSFYFFNGGIKGLQHYLSILSEASLFIGPSTGTGHLASALGIPLIGLYSPIKVQSAKRWRPLLRDAKRKQFIFFPDVICGEQSKCAGAICPYFECMSKIEVSEVAYKALEFLNLENKELA